MDLAQLVVQVKQKQAVKSLDNVQNKLQDVGKTAENIGKTLLAGWSFAKITDSLKTFSNMMNDVNTQARNFKTIFADSLDYANTQVQNLIKNFDQTERSAQKLMAQIGSKIIQVGFSPVDATKITSQFAVISEQISAATGKPLEQVAKKLTNALTGETGGLREIGMVIQTNSASFKQQVKLLMQSKDLTEQQAKKQVILNTVLKQSEKYAGAFKETANTISHQLDNIKNTFKSGMGAQIGSILNKLLVPILKIVDKVLSIPIIKNIGAISGALTILIGMFSSIWIILKKIFGFGWRKLAGFFNSLISSVREYNGVIKKLTRNIEENKRKIKQHNKLKKQELLLYKLIIRQKRARFQGLVDL